MFKKVRQTCIYPSPWKAALVAPVWKKGDRRDVRNYRPVSLLPVSSKLLEKCIFMDLYDFVRPKLNNLQFGFRRNRSAVSQMLVYLDKVYKALDRGEQVEVLYTDFEKAFDKIDHAKILKKLEHWSAWQAMAAPQILFEREKTSRPCRRVHLSHHCSYNWSPPRLLTGASSVPHFD